MPHHNTLLRWLTPVRQFIKYLLGTMKSAYIIPVGCQKSRYRKSALFSLVIPWWYDTPDDRIIKDISPGRLGKFVKSKFTISNLTGHFTA